MRRVRGGLWMLLAAVGAGACATAPARLPAIPGAVPAPPLPARSSVPRIVLPASALTEDRQILHVLNRLGYGPRPGDIERVKRVGLARYIERQLDPASIKDQAMEPWLGAYPMLAMSAAELVRDYPRPRAQREAPGMAPKDMTPKEMLEAFPLERRPYRITEAMQAAKVTRAIWSERQLQEVMTDFWFNHFNVFALKGAVQWMVPVYEKEAIRPHVLGPFRDLVRATARHPAMLFYLDNWLSTQPDFIVPAGPNKGRKLGLNENYGRELMELHTLGVDGGYTQEDVIEVARCFTGWTIDRPEQGGGFVFRPRAHDQGAKRVLGHVIPAGGGEQDGERVIDILVSHPSTARFVSTKLIRRFVSDDPPPALVDRTARTFRDTKGDIRAVLVTIFSSTEFFSAEAYRAKIKTPLHVVASAARAVGVLMEPLPTGAGPVPAGAIALARQVAKLGEPLYEAQPPTGHADSAEAWVSAGGLLNRMNFALALTQNRVPSLRVDLDGAVAGADRTEPRQVLDRLLTAMLHGEVTGETRSILAAQLERPEIARVTADDHMGKNTDVEKLAALVLGSPEFQRR